MSYSEDDGASWQFADHQYIYQPFAKSGDDNDSCDVFTSINVDSNGYVFITGNARDQGALDEATGEVVGLGPACMLVSLDEGKTYYTYNMENSLANESALRGFYDTDIVNVSGTEYFYINGMDHFIKIPVADVIEEVEAEELAFAADSDRDGVADADDVCPNVADDQSDEDGDGLGDACDIPDFANYDVFDGYICPKFDAGASGTFGFFHFYDSDNGLFGCQGSDEQHRIATTTDGGYSANLITQTDLANTRALGEIEVNDMVTVGDKTYICGVHKRQINDALDEADDYPDAYVFAYDSTTGEIKDIFDRLDGDPDAKLTSATSATCEKITASEDIVFFNLKATGETYFIAGKESGDGWEWNITNRRAFTSFTPTELFYDEDDGSFYYGAGAFIRNPVLGKLSIDSTSLAITLVSEVTFYTEADYSSDGKIYGNIMEITRNALGHLVVVYESTGTDNGCIDEGSIPKRSKSSANCVFVKYHDGTSWNDSDLSSIYTPEVKTGESDSSCAFAQDLKMDSSGNLYLTAYSGDSSEACLMVSQDNGETFTNLDLKSLYLETYPETDPKEFVLNTIFDMQFMDLDGQEVMLLQSNGGLIRISTDFILDNL